MSSYISMFFDERVMRNYRPEYVPAKQYYDVAEVEQGVCGLGRGVASIGDDADGKRPAAIPAESTMPSLPAIFPMPSVTLRKLEPKIDALAAILRQGERDRGKVTTPRWQAGLRPGDGPVVGGEGSHRRLQRDAGNRQARLEVQGREERHLGAAADRFGNGEQRPREGCGGRQEISESRS